MTPEYEKFPLTNQTHSSWDRKDTPCTQRVICYIRDSEITSGLFTKLEKDSITQGFFNSKVKVNTPKSIFTCYVFNNNNDKMHILGWKKSEIVLC